MALELDLARFDGTYRPKVISTFSGMGGSTIGYKLAGCDVRLAVEWEENAAKTYAHNFPKTALFHGDIANISVAKARELAGLRDDEELDIFDGSPPCQGFSTAKRGGRDPNDARNLLFLEYARLLRGLQPRAFIMENVRGMIIGQMKPIFEEVIATLRGCGYNVKARLLNAKWYGVAQARERVIFIGFRNDLGIEASHPAPTVAKPITVGEALADLVVTDAPPPVSERYQFFWRRVRPGRSAKDEVMLKIGNDGWFGIAKVDPNKPSPTIVKTVRIDGFGALYHWREPRVLAISEIKRLSSIPDDYELLGDFHDQWARVGNCVPPQLMRACAAHVRAKLAAKLGLPLESASLAS